VSLSCVAAWTMIRESGLLSTHREMKFHWQPDEIEQRRNGRLFIRSISIETLTIASRVIHGKIVRVVILKKRRYTPTWFFGYDG